MKGERLQILKMLEEGKITADDAIRLLDTVESGPVKPTQSRNRFVRVRITDGDRDKVNVNLPINLAKLALRIAANFDRRLEDIDLDTLVDEIEQGAEGRLVEVTEGDQRVEIFVE